MEYTLTGAWPQRGSPKGRSPTIDKSAGKNVPLSRLMQDPCRRDGRLLQCDGWRRGKSSRPSPGDAAGVRHGKDGQGQERGRKRWGKEKIGRGKRKLEKDVPWQVMVCTSRNRRLRGREKYKEG